MADVDLEIVLAWNGISGVDEERHAERVATGGPGKNPEMVVLTSAICTACWTGQASTRSSMRNCTSSGSIYSSDSIGCHIFKRRGCTSCL